MSTYKLWYFNITGLAESLRMMLSQLGIKFEDNRVSFDEWTKIKPTMPMGQMPVLEIDGKKYNQSKAIGRYLAKKGNLYGANDLEALQIDSTIDSIDDMRVPLSTYYWEKDPACKAKLKDAAFEKKTSYLEKLDAQVKNNGGYLVGGKLSWADIVYTAYSEYLNAVVGGDFNKDHPELKKLVEKVRVLPNIKAYIEKRPKAEF